MKYGCRAHDYGSFTAQELARTLADQGYNAAQLAMSKAIRGIADMNGISPEQLEEIRTAFAEADVEITVLSCYRDLSSPDDGTRTAAVADVCRALHYQKATGAKQVGSESSCRFLSEEQKAAELPLLTDRHPAHRRAGRKAGCLLCAGTGICTRAGHGGKAAHAEGDCRRRGAFSCDF